MDATRRWETEALRDGASSRPAPPRPTAKRRSGGPDVRRHWVTLREAETATGIPINTLRKWVRRAGLPSYLESDGETPVRMVDLDAVRARAAELGREIAPVPVGEAPESRSHGAPEPRSPGAAEPQESDRAPAADTMLVPVDAWNKMLAQLGNLHEAGQQLAEARERAAKAETEAEFLRRRLAELRNEEPSDSADAPPVHAVTTGDDPVAPGSDDPGVGDREDDAAGVPTTSFLRYVTVGWRNRRRSSR